ncbi:MAG TPA: DUF4290 domain-containing protein [Flavobacteriales bacterium]|jgi:hypothetical protein|nr:DUF4290 domain-containing protein [Flavobacteriales bacterium]HAW20845.1 DUF4290 domain-containing protein [Flavobacteriales bacterium]
MDYATQKESLILAEYGRHVQDMVKHALTIEDRTKRNEAAETIVLIMTQLNPSYKGSDELQQKLWEDLFIISNYELDVDSPFPKPEPKNDIIAEKVDYPDQKFKFKHYGKIIEALIEAAVKIENPEEQQELIQQIANLMKRSYLNFNRDSVNEDMIVDQLTSMSDGKLKLSPEFKFVHTNDIVASNPIKRTNRNQGKGRGKRKWKK